jgi:hypothetical protein
MKIIKAEKFVSYKNITFVEVLYFTPYGGGALKKLPREKRNS